MILDPNEKIFLVPMGKRKDKTIYAQFRFKPYMQIQAMLDEYNVPYEMDTERFKHVLLINSNIQGMVWYRIPCNNPELPDKKYHQFIFTSDIIDKICKRYHIELERKEEAVWKRIV